MKHFALLLRWNKKRCSDAVDGGMVLLKKTTRYYV
jgi:hypothetical protein